MTTELTEHRPAVRAWLELLRDPATLQARGALSRQVTRDGPRSYCCLGVAEQARPNCRWVHRDLVDRRRNRYGAHVLFVAVHDDDPAEVDEVDEANEVDEVRYTELLRLSAGALNPATARWLGVEERDPCVALPGDLVDAFPHGAVQTLSYLNDALQLPLATIADVIERQPFNWDGTYERADATVRGWRIEEEKS